MEDQKDKESFEYLRDLALKFGASDAKIIPSNKIIIEDRVTLKCKVGCINYGKTLMCPPFTPTPEEFRKIVGEYRFALFVKFTSKAEADIDLQKSLSKPDKEKLSEEQKEKIEKFWAEWKKDKRQMLNAIIEIEKEAMRKGYSLAVGFVSGKCDVCEKCSGIENGICLYPEKTRFSEDAVGVNVRKTAENAGIESTFPFKKNPESFAMLLID